MNKKECKICGKEKVVSAFYKISNNDNFPDERYHTCSECLRTNQDYQNVETIHKFLKEIDKVFLKDQWLKAENKKGFALSNYLKSINMNYGHLLYKDSDIKFGVKDTKKTKDEKISDLNNQSSDSLPSILDKEGNSIILSDIIISKWRALNDEYTDNEILSLEKLFVDMKYDYDIKTGMEEQMLIELCELSILKNQLRTKGMIKEFKDVSAIYRDTMRDAGFRPIDRKDNLEKTGIDSFGQVIAQLEQDLGFIPPNRIDFPMDDIDKMLLYYKQWAQGFTNQSIDTSIDPQWRDKIIEEELMRVNVEENSDYDETDMLPDGDDL